MTKHSGPTEPVHNTLPIRSANLKYTSMSNEIIEYIRNAVSAGRSISAFLADALNQITLATNEKSKLHTVVALAEELRVYQSPVEFTIALIGDSGVGKSSLINSLLDEKKLARTAGTGEACTTVVTEYRNKRWRDNSAYTAEIECMNSTEIDDLVEQSVVDYRRYHLLRIDSHESSEERQRLQVQARVAWDTLSAVFGDREECTEIRFKNPDPNEVEQLISGWKDDIVWPQGFNTPMTVLESPDVDILVSQIDRFLSARMWPFIKVVRIYLESDVLRNGIVLVDLPGFRDTNSARVRIAETKLYQCDEIFLVTDICRAASNVGVEDVVVRQLGRNFDGLRRSQGVAIICTKSENLGQEDEILRDVPNTEVFSPSIVRSLMEKIEEAEENGQPTKYLRARRDHRFISARNQHVEQVVRAHYAAEVRNRRIDIFCVSNNLYRDSCTLRARVQHHRQSLNARDWILAADQMLASSEICTLRRFCQDIPSMSQILETRHFLNTRLVSLFEKVGMWLNVSVPEVAANQHAAPGFLDELQAELKATFEESVDGSHEGLANAKMEMLQQPFTEGKNRWEQEALSIVRSYEGWHVASLSAFWNRQGIHATPARPYTNWNAEIIKAMVQDVQHFEQTFCSRSDEIFDILRRSLHEELSVFLTRLGDFRGVVVFSRTFPRRRRELDHEVINLIDSFNREIQAIFHNLCGTHGASYTMRHMLPMYNRIETEVGMKRRLLRHFYLHIEGDANIPKLFNAIGDSFISAVNSQLEVTYEGLMTATDRFCENIGNDLDLLRGEDVEVTDQNDALDGMFNILEEAQRRREEVLSEFNARVHEHEALVS